MEISWLSARLDNSRELIGESLGNSTWVPRHAKYCPRATTPDSMQSPLASLFVECHVRRLACYRSVLFEIERIARREMVAEECFTARVCEGNALVARCDIPGSWVIIEEPAIVDKSVLLRRGSRERIGFCEKRTLGDRSILVEQ